jgi:hypothetical protein
MIFKRGREDRNSDECMDNKNNINLRVKKLIGSSAVISATLMAEH